MPFLPSKTRKKGTKPSIYALFALKIHKKGHKSLLTMLSLLLKDVGNSGVFRHKSLLTMLSLLLKDVGNSGVFRHKSLLTMLSLLPQESLDDLLLGFLLVQP